MRMFGKALLFGFAARTLAKNRRERIAWLKRTLGKKEDRNVGRDAGVMRY